ncbi:MAG: UDP-N-acetylglucosamine 2-epimerase (non-hydrolyzing), partial [Deltaproteobacteria bacterium]
MRKKLAFLLGTRPEVIKLAPLIAAGGCDDAFDVTVISSGQHDEMLRQALTVFGIEPAYDLALMTREQTLTDITVRVLRGLEPLLARIAPDLLIVQGDTTTAFAGALAAFYQKIPVAHVEAGLRTWQRDLPFPEEMNRAMIASLAELHFAPTPGARENLLACGVAPEKIFVTGNTVIDALLSVDGGEEASSLLASVPEGAPVVLATAHRREHHGPPLEEIARAIRRIVETHPE